MKRTVTLKMPVEVEVDLVLVRDQITLKVVSAVPTKILKPTDEDLEDLRTQLAEAESELEYKHHPGNPPLLTQYLWELLEESGEVIHSAYKKEPVCGVSTDQAMWTTDVYWLFHTFKDKGMCESCHEHIQNAFKKLEEHEAKKKEDDGDD